MTRWIMQTITAAVTSLTIPAIWTACQKTTTTKPSLVCSSTWHQKSTYHHNLMCNYPFLSQMAKFKLLKLVDVACFTFVFLPIVLLFACLPVDLSVCLPFYLSAWLSVFVTVSICLSVSVTISICLSVCLSCLSDCLTVSVCNCLSVSVWLSLCVTVCVSVYMSVQSEEHARDSFVVLLSVHHHFFTVLVMMHLKTDAAYLAHKMCLASLPCIDRHQSPDHMKHHSDTCTFPDTCNHSYLVDTLLIKTSKSISKHTLQRNN